MMTQLDLKCAEAGKLLAEINGVEEKLLNAALAVLQGQGLYACFLYLRAQGKDPGRQMFGGLYNFLEQNLPGFKQSSQTEKKADQMTRIAKLSENLDDLLFARELLLQVLTYARYHLKTK